MLIMRLIIRIVNNAFRGCDNPRRRMIATAVEIPLEDPDLRKKDGCANFLIATAVEIPLEDVIYGKSLTRHRDQAVRVW